MHTHRVRGCAFVPPPHHYHHHHHLFAKQLRPDALPRTLILERKARLERHDYASSSGSALGLQMVAATLRGEGNAVNCFDQALVLKLGQDPHLRTSNPGCVQQQAAKHVCGRLLCPFLEHHNAVVAFQIQEVNAQRS